MFERRLIEVLISTCCPQTHDGSRNCIDCPAGRDDGQNQWCVIFDVTEFEAELKDKE
jgi:hypothetical protein